MNGKNRAHSGEGVSPEIAGTNAAASSHPAGNGKDPRADGIGQRNPFEDVFGDHAEDDGAWHSDLPTEEEVRAKPSSIYATAKLRALVKQQDSNLEAYVDLVHRLVAAADNPDVTRAKVNDAVKKQAAKDRQEMKAAAIDEMDGDKETVVDALIRLGKQGTELFHAPDGQAYVTVTSAGHPQTVRVGGGSFLELLLNRFMDETGRAASIDALKTAAMNLAAIAKRDSAPKYAVFPRVGTQDGNIYVDRGSASI